MGYVKSGFNQDVHDFFFVCIDQVSQTANRHLYFQVVSDIVFKFLDNVFKFVIIVHENIANVIAKTPSPLRKLLNGKYVAHGLFLFCAFDDLTIFIEIFIGHRFQIFNV
jgi:hypothetical protein